MLSRKKKAVDMLKAAPLVASRQKRRNRRIASKTIWTIALTLLAIGLIILPFALAGTNAYRHAMIGKANLEAAEASINALDLESAENEALDAARAFSFSRAEVSKFNFLVPFPWFGERLVAAESLLATGQVSAEAISEAIGVGRQVLGAVGEGALPLPGQILPQSGIAEMNAEKKRQILIALSESGPKMRVALGRIEQSMRAFDNLPDNELIQPYRERLDELKTKLQTTSYAIDAILPAVENLPKALGYPEAQRYLFFFQNNTEMRPTGGFLGLVGQMTVKDGELESIDVSDTYAYDGPSVEEERPPAPLPIQKYARVKQWYLRDANWSPDFTESAPRMEQFFLDEAEVKDGVRPEGFDGVIAITPNLAADILRLTGPITVEGHTFNADNLVDELEFQVEMAFEEQGISRDDRKVIVGKLMMAIIEKATKFSLPQLLELVSTIQRNLAEGQVLLFSKDTIGIQKLILLRDWGGQLQRVNGDYLMVVDANLAALKTDPVVDRQIKYTVRPDGSDGHEGKVAITYTNNGSFTWKTTRYRTYTRLYLPRGSELLEVTGALENDKLNDPAGTPGKADTGVELSRQWFGAFISIEPGESRTLEFRFKLAKSVEEMLAAGEYRLTFEKQPGTPGYGLTLDLDFGKKLIAAEPAENAKNFGDDLYQIDSDLKLDRYFKVFIK